MKHYGNITPNSKDVVTSEYLEGHSVQSVTAGTGLSGGTITETGTISHATGAGYNHIPSGGASGNVLTWASSGTAQWGAASNGVIIQNNKTVATSAWASDTTYADFPYRASVAITGVTTSHVPEVYFSVADATSGNFAPVADSYSGGVYIYAAEKPTATVTIPTIMCTKQL